LATHLLQDAAMKLIFEHKGPVVVVHRHHSGAWDSHSARRLTIHAFQPCFRFFPGLHVSYVERRFNLLTEFPVTDECLRYCQVFAPNGTPLFDSRDVIRWETAPPATITPMPVDRYGKRLHSRQFRDLRNG
jgi:hypothetical protein